MQGIIITGIIGLVAGYVASRLQRGAGSGFIVNLILGLIGGVVGGWLFALSASKPIACWVRCSPPSSALSWCFGCSRS